MGTTILRFKKINNFVDIQQAGAHQHRQHIETLNANSKLTCLNRLVFGSSNVVSDVNKRLSVLDKKPRKNSVLVVEGLISLSPGLFRSSDDEGEDLEALNVWYSQSKIWLKEQFGDNLVNAVLHRDESTPHIHFMIVPVIENEGKTRLCAREMFSRETLRNFQKSYYRAFQGRIRGINPPTHGSKRRHTEIKHFYAVLDAVKADLHVAAGKLLKEIRNDCKDILINTYLPLVDSAIKDVEDALNARLSDEVRIKIKKDYELSIKDKVEGVLIDTSLMKFVKDEMENAIKNATVIVSKSGQRVSFKK